MVYRNYICRAGIVILVLSSVALLTWNISNPWVGQNDSVGALYGTAARHFLEYGFVATKFGIALHEQHDRGFAYYINHPPLLPFLIALSYHLFGVQEWSTRIVPILFSVGSIFLIYLLGKEIRDRTAGLLAAFILLFIPMFSYFGRLPNFEPVVTFFVLTSFESYLRWSRSHRARYFVGILLSQFLACLTDWPGYFIAPALAIYHFSTSRNRFALFPGLALNLLLFGFFVWHVVFLSGPSAYRELIRAFLIRTNIEGASLEASPFTLAQFCYEHAYRILLYFTISGVVGSFIWLRGLLREDRKKENVLLAILAVAIANVALFPQGSMTHHFWLFYFAPYFALSSSFAFLELWNSGRAAMKGAVPLLLAFLFAHSIWLVDRRHHQNNGYPLDYRLSKTLQEQIRPHKGCISSFSLIPSFCTFYARVPVISDVRTEEAFLKVTKQEPGYDCFVTTTSSLFSTAAPEYSYTDETALKSIGVLSESDGFLVNLMDRFPYQIVNGFIVFHLLQEPRTRS